MVASVLLGPGYNSGALPAHRKVLVPATRLPDEPAAGEAHSKLNIAVILGSAESELDLFDPEAEASFRALTSLLADSRKAAKPAGLADAEAAAVPLNEPAQRRQSRQLRGAQSTPRRFDLR